jgi:hypothetical protein
MQASAASIVRRANVQVDATGGLKLPYEKTAEDARVISGLWAKSKHAVPDWLPLHQNCHNLLPTIAFLPSSLLEKGLAFPTSK